MKTAILLFAAFPLFAADPPKAPELPAELRARFEHDRNTEGTSARKHDADLAKVRADYAEAERICGERFTPQFLTEDAQLTCIQKPEPVKEGGK